MRNSKIKRVLTGAMAGVMALSISATAFAAAPAAPTTEINATYTAPTINVTIPSTAVAAFINPYGLPVELGTKSDNTVVKSAVNTQIVTKPASISNETDLNLDVNASLIGVAKGNLKFAIDAASVEGTADAPVTSNSVYAVLEFAGNADALGDASTAVSEDDVKDAVLTLAGNASWTAVSGMDQLVLGLRAVSGKVCTLAKSTLKDDGSGDVQSYGVGGVQAFRLAGKVVADPKIEWASTDGFDATITWTFKPSADQT